MNKNSMVYWHAMTRDLPILQPRTEIIPIPNGQLTAILDSPGTFHRIENKIHHIMDLFDTLPIFLRTDMSSQKFHFRKTCRLPNKAQLFGHLLELLDINTKSNIVDNALVFREWLDLYSGFYAFDGLPISIEARVSIIDNRTNAVFPYWTEGTIISNQTAEQSKKLNPRWRDILYNQNRIVVQSEEKLRTLAEPLARLFDGIWNADFAMDASGNWNLIDMNQKSKTPV